MLEIDFYGTHLKSCQWWPNSLKPTFFFIEMSILGGYRSFCVFLSFLHWNCCEQRFLDFSRLLLGLWLLMGTQNVHKDSLNMIKYYLDPFKETKHVFLKKNSLFFNNFLIFKKNHIFQTFVSKPFKPFLLSSMAFKVSKKYYFNLFWLNGWHGWLT